MRVGDILEWLGAAALVAAAFIWSGTILALAVTGVALAYFAQCYDATPLRRKRVE
jgi:hypothetical protein